MKRVILFLAILLVSVFPAAQDDIQKDINANTVAAGLYHPVGMALLPDGGVLIAEAGGHGERSAGISLLRPDGELGRLLSGALSEQVNGNLINAPALAVTPDGETIIFGFAGAQLYSLPSAQAGRLPRQPFTPSALTRRQTERGNVFLLNPFDIAFDNAGSAIVSDAAGSGLLREGDDGALEYVHHFAALENPAPAGGRLDPLPTGIAHDQGRLYVTLFGGCPHAANGGHLVAITEDGGQETIAAGLNMPIDVAVDAAGDLWLVEFGVPASSGDCFRDFDAQAASGRLSRINRAGILETMADGLHFPAAVLPLPDGSLYVTEVYTGRLLHFTFDAASRAPRRYPPREPTPASTAEIIDADAVLRRVIAEQGLSANPGRDVLEPESELTRLGRDLFFDPILSGDQNISCGTCHHPAFAMTDGRALPIGAGGHGLGASRVFREHISVAPSSDESLLNPFIDVFIPRNSPTILNSALLNSQFWDGRVERRPQQEWVTTLEDAINDLDLTDPLMAQVLFPITSQHEMAGFTFGDFPPMVIRLSLLERLRNHGDYAARFASVFGRPSISLRQLAEAIAAFERQLIFTDAPWDDYLAGDSAALSDSQKRGALLFFGALNDGVNCATCHSGDLFTDQAFHNLLAPQVGPGKDNGRQGNDDFGRANVTFDYRDQYRFRTPGLRNVELTAPYFHSGAYQTLEAVIRHHADPWRANIVYDPAAQLPTELQDQVLPYDFERQGHSVARPMQARLPLDEADLADLVDFLRSLTDPAARDLSHITPTEVPSGLPLDPLPDIASSAG